MKKKVILFFPKLEEEKDYHYMPVSLLAVAATFVNEEIECVIIDERVDNNYIELLNNNLEESSIIAFTAYTGFQVTRAYEISKYVKKNFNDITVIWGGPHTTYLPDEVIKSKYVDIVYRGYAEASFKDLINELISENVDLANVNNILYEFKDTIIKNDINFEIKEFSDIPYELVEANKYVNPKTERFIYISTYGCPGRCTFCATKTIRKWIEIPIDKVQRDIDKLMNLYSFKECIFFDATIFTRHDRAIKISEMMKAYNLRWIADARAQEIYNMDEDKLEYVINNGLTQITVGLETGSENVAKLMNKGEKHLERFKISAKKLSKFNIKLCSGVIFGFPGETIEDLKQTINYIKEIKSINSNFFISTTFFKPLPDTVAMDVVSKQGYHPSTLEEWAKLGDSNHYKYNEWCDVPWMKDIDIKEYKRIYDEFKAENTDLFI